MKSCFINNKIYVGSKTAEEGRAKNIYINMVKVIRLNSCNSIFIIQKYCQLQNMTAF